jgi:hypothetical protein
VEKIITENNCPPYSDWSAYPDGCEKVGPIGHGRTEALAIANLYDMIAEREDRDAIALTN